MPIAQLPDVALHYLQIPASRRRLSDRNDIIMIHGLAASCAFWYSAGAERLSRFGDVTLYDLRGHGRSEMPLKGYSASQMATDLERLMDETGIKAAHLVAHSFGGMIALLFALRQPERVLSLVLADVRVRAIQPEIRVRRKKITRRLQVLSEELGISLDVAHPRDGINYLEQIARVQLQNPGEAETILQKLYGQPIRFYGRRAARRWINLLEQSTLLTDVQTEETFTRKDVRKITQPTLVLVGAKSSTLPSCRIIANECQNAELKIIPDVGHFFPLSRPAMFLRPTMRFLRNVSVTRMPLHIRPRTDVIRK